MKITLDPVSTPSIHDRIDDDDDGDDDEKEDEDDDDGGWNIGYNNNNRG